MAYATVDELKSEIDLLDTAGKWTVTLTRLLNAATRSIDRYCNRPDGFVADDTANARIYAGNGKPYLLIDECVEVTLVEVKDSATDTDYNEWATGDWIAFSGDARAPDFNSLPYTALMVDPTGNESIFTSGAYTTKAGFRPTTDIHRGVPTVRITARWGFASTVPYDIQEACVMQASLWFKELQAAMSGTLAEGELGKLTYRKSLNPSIVHLLADGRYIKPTVGRR